MVPSLIISYRVDLSVVLEVSGIVDPTKRLPDCKDYSEQKEKG